MPNIVIDNKSSFSNIIFPFPSFIKPVVEKKRGISPTVKTRRYSFSRPGDWCKQNFCKGRTVHPGYRLRRLTPLDKNHWFRPIQQFSYNLRYDFRITFIINYRKHKLIRCKLIIFKHCKHSWTCSTYKCYTLLIL